MKRNMQVLRRGAGGAGVLCGFCGNQYESGRVVVKLGYDLRKRCRPAGCSPSLSVVNEG